MDPGGRSDTGEHADPADPDGSTAEASDAEEADAPTNGGQIAGHPGIVETSLVDVSKSRLRVLKALEDDRRTASELARELAMTKSTVHGYLQDLVGDGLVDRHDPEERMWVYYTLSETGERIVDRDRLTLVVDLGAIVAFLASAALGVHRFFFAAEPSGGGPGALGGPSPDPGTPWATIAYVASLVLVLVGIGLHVYLRRATVHAREDRA